MKRVWQGFVFGLACSLELGAGKMRASCFAEQGAMIRRARHHVPSRELHGRAARDGDTAETTWCPSLLEAVRQLEALGMVPRLDPDFARELAEQCGVGSTLPVPVATLPPSVVVVPAEQCPNCAHVETECQCGDLRIVGKALICRRFEQST